MLAPTSNASSTNPWLSSSQPSPAASGQLSGACALLAALVQAQCSTQSSAKGDIEHGFDRLDELKNSSQTASVRPKKRRTTRAFSAFWATFFGSDIAQIAGAVAAVAAAVATAGAASPAASDRDFRGPAVGCHGRGQARTRSQDLLRHRRCFRGSRLLQRDGHGASCG